MTDGNDRAMSSPIYSYDNEMHMVGYAKGLTKREAFAMAAIQGLCVQAIAGGHNVNCALENNEKASHAVAIADALIAALNKPQETKA